MNARTTPGRALSTRSLRYWNPAEPHPSIAPTLGPGLLVAIYNPDGVRLSPWAPLAICGPSGNTLSATFTAEAGWDPTTCVVWDGDPSCRTWMQIPYATTHHDVREGDELTVILPNLSGHR